MEQEYILFNDIKIKQPDYGSLTHDWSTTYTDDSDRDISGMLHITPLFTYESFGYSVTNITLEEVKQILQIVIKGYPFKVHYLSPYYGKWRDDKFYVAKGSASIGLWKQEEEVYDSFSFNFIGVNPL